MNQELRRVDVKCPACGARDNWGLEKAVRYLICHGKFRRTSTPDPDLVFELVFAFASKLTCAECEATGLEIAWAKEDESSAGDWQEAILCQACRKPIPADRLAVVPGATLCVPCQEQMDRGMLCAKTAESDFCPKCGAPTKMEARNVGGVTKYVLVCTNFPRCRGFTE